MPATQRVFVDTGALYARVDRADAHHAQAVATFVQLARAKARISTTCLVVSEAFTLLQRRLGHALAMRWLDAASRSRLTVIWPDSEVAAIALQILSQFRDQDFSFTDAVSFACMEQRGIRRYLSFDHHFAVFGRPRGWHGV